MTRLLRSSRLLAALLAVSTLSEAAAAAGAKASETPRAVVDLPACVVAYHASLKRIAAEDLPRIGTGPAPAETAGEADASLPGMPLFVPPSRKRSAADMATLTAAVALARSRGRSASMIGAASDGDRTWIAARLKEDLSDYLNQNPTPYLCSGVPAYLETLRKFAGRLGPMSDRRPEWIATQRRAAEESVKAADEAIAMARTNAPQTVAQAELRPGTDLRRTEASREPERPIDGEAAILSAIDRLVAESRAAGLVSEAPVPQITGATAPPALPSRPVLAKLGQARPLVVSARPLVRDRTVRLKLLAAFADLEMLDYLMKAKADTPDPLAAAFGKTFDDIASAHKADCICGR